MSRAINIISFDIPFPANYGGVIDVYYKLVWLKKSGVKIYLHCFSYGRANAPELEALCEKVYYYKRNTGLLANLSTLPYTVNSRQSSKLKKNLLSNTFPILFEVLHTCYLLNDPKFKDRRKIYRHSNIEHDYYLELSRTEKFFYKKVYLKIEAYKLKHFESILKFANIILAVNKKDSAYFKVNYPSAKTIYLPSFHSNNSVTSLVGKGNFILFHGNLSISENYEAATWLIANVFSKINLPVIIAGLKPPAFLVEIIKKYSHINLIDSPPEKKLDELIHDAQLHVLYTAQPTGLKLKLVNVLFKGRYVICNNNITEGTELTENTSFMLANTSTEILKKINSIFEIEFSQAHLSERKMQTANFENAKNCERLIESIF